MTDKTILEYWDLTPQDVHRIYGLVKSHLNEKDIQALNRLRAALWNLGDELRNINYEFLSLHREDEEKMLEHIDDIVTDLMKVIYAIPVLTKDTK